VYITLINIKESGRTDKMPSTTTTMQDFKILSKIGKFN
jgi:hypothetical protein